MPKHIRFRAIRVVCPECGKDICNRYSLRTHLIVAHKIQDPEARIRAFAAEHFKPDSKKATDRNGGPDVLAIDRLITSIQSLTSAIEKATHAPA